MDNHGPANVLGLIIRVSLHGPHGVFNSSISWLFAQEPFSFEQQRIHGKSVLLALFGWNSLVTGGFPYWCGNHFHVVMSLCAVTEIESLPFQGWTDDCSGMKATMMEFSESDCHRSRSGYLTSDHSTRNHFIWMVVRLLFLVLLQSRYRSFELSHRYKCYFKFMSKTADYHMPIWLVMD